MKGMKNTNWPKKGRSCLCGSRGEQGEKRQGKEGGGEEKGQSVFQRQQAVGSAVLGVARIWHLKTEL